MESTRALKSALDSSSKRAVFEELNMHHYLIDRCLDIVGLILQLGYCTPLCHSVHRPTGSVPNPSRMQ